MTFIEGRRAAEDDEHTEVCPFPWMNMTPSKTKFCRPTALKQKTNADGGRLLLVKYTADLTPHSCVIQLGLRPMNVLHWAGMTLSNGPNWATTLIHR